MDDGEKSHIRKKSAVSKKRLLIGSFVGVVIIAVIIFVFFYYTKIEDINKYSNSTLVSEFGPLSDFQSIKSDYFNKTLNLEFDLAFDRYLSYKEQYITLDKFREEYLSLMKKQGYWKNVKKEDITVEVTYFPTVDTTELRNTVLTSTDDNNKFNGGALEKKENDSIKYLSSLEQQYEQDIQTYDDTGCNANRDGTLAKFQCVQSVIQDDCSVYMGQYMRDGKAVNFGKVEDTNNLKACINEHISPENIPFPYKEGN